MARVLGVLPEEFSSQYSDCSQTPGTPALGMQRPLLVPRTHAHMYTLRVQKTNFKRCKLDRVVHTYNPSTPGIEVES